MLGPIFLRDSSLRYVSVREPDPRAGAIIVFWSSGNFGIT